MDRDGARKLRAFGFALLALAVALLASAAVQLGAL
jgi:hypothetical protein